MASEIDLVRFATVSADLAEGDRTMREVLEAHGIDDAKWDEASRHWSSPEWTIAFGEAFAAAQDAKKPIPPYDVVGWATLVNDVQEIGLARALAKRQISKADYFRLVRHWAKAIATNVELSKAYAAART